MAPSKETSERHPSLTATLYCPRCTHEGRINGDWILHIRADALDYECPKCGATVDSRRVESALTTQSARPHRSGSAN